MKHRFMKMKCKQCGRKVKSTHRTITCDDDRCPFIGNRVGMQDILDFSKFPLDVFDTVAVFACKAPDHSKSSWDPENGWHNFIGY